MIRDEAVKIQEALRGVGADADERAAETLARYMDLVLEKNRDINLTAITDREKFIREHYAGSACAARLPEYREAESVIDVGTGAGFPGVVLAVLSPEKKFTLVDSLAKRLRVIEGFLSELGIGNVTLIHGRAEELAHEDGFRESFDLAVSRAVAALPALLELTLPFVRVGGALIAYKGASAAGEVEKSARAVNMLGGGTPDILHAGVSGTEHRLVVVKKEGETPPGYPRKPGTPVKKPL